MSENRDDLVLVNQNQVELDGSDTSSEEPKISSPFDPTKIRVDTKNTQMDTLIKRMRRDEIDLTPGFQRQAGVWTEVIQSRLIESMLIKIPLPAFYMDATDDDNWLVVDGLQRLTTIKRFVIDKSMVLEGLEFLTDYNGKKFDELPRGFQRRIEETDIVIYQIQPGTPSRVKFDIFRRINTGGLPLSAQEIRHALNQGRIVHFLIELAESEKFKKATSNGVSSKRMDDRECVLRFLAFSLTPPEEYKDDSFDLFLNDAMAKFNKMNDDDLEKYRLMFNEAMNAAVDIFGNDAFRKRYDKKSGRHPINKALFEAWSVNLGLLDPHDLRRLSDQKDSLIDRFINLMQDKNFETAITQGTGSVKRVKLRFAKISEIIQEELQC